MLHAPLMRVDTSATSTDLLESKIAVGSICQWTKVKVFFMLTIGVQGIHGLEVLHVKPIYHTIYSCSIWFRVESGRH